jgi:UDP-N-acetylglucosamine acyltransferase
MQLGDGNESDKKVFPQIIKDCQETLNLVGLQRSGASSEDLSELKKAFRLVYRSNMTFQAALEQLKLMTENVHVQHLYHFLQNSLTDSDRRGTIPGKALKV